MSDSLHFIRAGKSLDPEAKVEMIECGSCEYHHRADFWGDCRTDSQRFMPHDGSGDPEYECENGHHWITETEWWRRQEALAEAADIHSPSQQDQGAAS